MSGSLELLDDACAGLPHTRRAMFGGQGYFAPNGGMFAAIVPGDRIALKFAAGTPGHAAFLAAGGEAWVYDEGPKPMTMREWLLAPADLYDDPRELAAWCRRAHAEVPAKRTKATHGAASKPRKR